MKTRNQRNDFPQQPVPELIKKLWTMYFEMSLDPELEESAKHIRMAALTLEHTRRLAQEVAYEVEVECADNAGENGRRVMEEDEFLEQLRNPKFGSAMKH